MSSPADRPSQASSEWSDLVGSGDRSGVSGVSGVLGVPGVPGDSARTIPAAPGLVTPAPVRRPALIGRFVVGLAGLLAAGCAVLGVALLMLVFLAPRTGGSGLEAATGPGWVRAAAHLGVGVGAEIALILVRRGSWTSRVTTATLVIAAVLLVLALSWWR